MFVDDSIVHATAIHNGAGLQPGNACVVRRSYPDGKPSGSSPPTTQVTAIDAVGYPVGTLDGRVLVCETVTRESYATRAATAQ
ncbi:hypothetical protein [Amycolatopsis circi]|uniref:hypothetical protein n=1 Tax=Amycolatopsis circi TaxID=871959 RepID=UPI000E277927|nr:hypothetical protein [Amycolatopsis circi]